MEIFDKKNKKLGFTLIELLVVIAIIGILAAIVLVSLQGARERARDARIISSMSQLRADSEVYHGSQTPNSYAGFCTATNTRGLLIDIGVQGGTPTTTACFAGPIDYCVGIQLNNGQFWCVDSDLRAQQYGANACASTSVSCQ